MPEGVVSPVWCWSSSQQGWALAGVFSHAGTAGSFQYDERFRSSGEARALDPQALPLSRSSKPFRETRQHGVFGVLRDVSLEGFGLTLAEERLRREDGLSSLERLLLTPADAVGAVLAGEGIAERHSVLLPTLDELLAALDRLSAQEPGSAAVPALTPQGTGLGGERPKLTVWHKGQQWIAKLQGEGDPPNTPLREFVAMRLARECGVDACEVEFFRAGERQVLLVRRFDRQAEGKTLQRHLFASCHTVLRLDADLRGARVRSYLAFAEEAQKWCQLRGTEGRELKRELWRRIAYNALSGNFDDHPRNHGLLHREERWALSPAYDIAPYPTPSGVLSMCVTRSGSALATRSNLLEASVSLDYEVDEARAFLLDSERKLVERWPEEVSSVGYDTAVVPYCTPSWLESR
jgi:serine/threonine-protein kinase HipA